MIERIVLSHVRCFESVDVPLKPLTVLIGPNMGAPMKDAGRGGSRAQNGQNGRRNNVR